MPLIGGDLAVLVVVGLIPVLFAIRSVYAIVAPTAAGGDAYDHLLYARDIAQSGHSLPDRPTKFATGGRYAYPYLVHWILSFVPERYFQTIERYFSAVSDLVFVFVIVASEPLGFLSWQGVAIAVALFVTAPQFVRPDLSHGTGLSTRKPGLTLVTASLLTFIAWTAGGSPWLLAAALLSGAGVCLTSKFGVQALLFISLGLGVVTPASVALLPGSVLVATVLSRGRYLSVLEAHLRHSYNYATTQQFMVSYAKPTRTFAGLASTLANLDSPRDLIETAYRNHLLRPIVSNPIVILAMGTLTMASMNTIDIASEMIGSWIFAGVGAYVLTSLPYLRFLGQGERYLEYTFLPSAIVVAHGWMSLGQVYRGVVVGIAAFGLLVIAVFIWAYGTVFAQGDDEAKNELLDVLKGLEPGVLLIQPRWDAAEIAWKTPHRVIDMSLNAGSTPEAIEEVNTLLAEDAGYVTADVELLTSRYAPDWVIFDIEKMHDDDALEDEAPWLTPPNTKPKFANGRFELYTFDAVKP